MFCLFFLLHSTLPSLHLSLIMPSWIILSLPPSFHHHTSLSFSSFYSYLVCVPPFTSSLNLTIPPSYHPSICPFFCHPESFVPSLLLSFSPSFVLSSSSLTRPFQSVETLSPAAARDQVASMRTSPKVGHSINHFQFSFDIIILVPVHDHIN